MQRDRPNRAEQQQRQLKKEREKESRKAAAAAGSKCVSGVVVITCFLARAQRAACQLRTYPQFKEQQ